MNPLKKDKLNSIPSISRPCVVKIVATTEYHPFLIVENVKSGKIITQFS